MASEHEINEREQELYKAALAVEQDAELSVNRHAIMTHL